jgi:disease resistance protein RPM1
MAYQLLLYKSIEMHLSNTPIMDMNIIMQVSLEDLPHNIRNCFMYCCLYSENYAMQRKSLVRIWVVGGGS